MIGIILFWLALAVVTEAITEIITESDIFFSFRNWLTKINPKFLGKLFSCGYCLSVWVACTLAWILPGDFCQFIELDPNFVLPLNIVLKIFLLHRLSNVVHGLLRRVIVPLPYEVVLTHVQAQDEVPVTTSSDNVADWKPGGESPDATPDATS